MAIKIILSKADAKLEGLVDSVFTELIDDENNIIDSVEKTYIKTTSILYSIRIHLNQFELSLNSIKKSNDINTTIEQLDNLSKLFKQLKSACRKIEVEGYKTHIEFSTNSIIINIEGSEAVIAKKKNIKGDLTLREFKYETVYNNRCVIIPDCEEHYIVDCLGGILSESYHELISAMTTPIEKVKMSTGQIGEVFNMPRIKLIGWEADIPSKESYDFNYYKTDFFSVTVEDITTKKRHKFYGYMFKETLKEFYRRIGEYAEGALDIMHRTNYIKASHIPFTIGTHYIESECTLSDAQDILHKFDEDVQTEIIDKCEEHSFRERQLKQLKLRY